MNIQTVVLCTFIVLGFFTVKGAPPKKTPEPKPQLPDQPSYLSARRNN